MQCARATGNILVFLFGLFANLFSTILQTWKSQAANNSKYYSCTGNMHKEVWQLMHNNKRSSLASIPQRSSSRSTCSHRRLSMYLPSHINKSQWAIQSLSITLFYILKSSSNLPLDDCAPLRGFWTSLLHRSHSKRMEQVGTSSQDYIFATKICNQNSRCSFSLR